MKAYSDNIDSPEAGLVYFVCCHSRQTVCRVQIHPSRCPSTTCMAPSHRSSHLIFPSLAAFHFFSQMASVKG